MFSSQNPAIKYPKTKVVLIFLNSTAIPAVLGSILSRLLSGSKCVVAFCYTVAGTHGTGLSLFMIVIITKAKLR
jgi:hypothetical protein